MTVLAKYFYKEFFKLLVLCLLVFVMIYHIISFVGGVDNFLESGVPMRRMLVYHLYLTPFIIMQMLPPATLIAVIIMFSLMKKNNEIVALKCAGMNLWQFSKPVIMASLFLSVALFFFSEIVVPGTSSKSREIFRVEVNKSDPQYLYGRRHIWFKGTNSIYWIGRFDKAQKILENFTLYFFDPSFRLIKRIDAHQGIWKEGKWEIKKGIVIKAEADGEYSFKRFDQLDLTLPETPDMFIREEKKPEEMSYWQLKRFAQTLSMEGYDATRYFVDLHVKLSFPFILLTMVLIGIPIALWREDVGTPLSVSLGLLFCFIYLLALGFSRSLGFADILPPILAAWLANGLFCFLGIYFMQYVER
jgi:lipopolysaccharide export system permease protein